MGREALKLPWYHPNSLPGPTSRTMHFVLTNISLPCNAGIAVQTSCNTSRQLIPRSPSRLERELQLISVECSFQQVCCPSLATSAGLLSSVTAFDLMRVI